MTNSFTIDRTTRIAEAWTPWGPQSIETSKRPVSPRLAALRRRLKRLGKDVKRTDDEVTDIERSRPECSYDL